MPYIEPQDREELTNGLREPATAGELNYIVTRAAHRYIARLGLSYAAVNEVVGVFECAKQELYRAVAANYEDRKRFRNGPVSDLDK